MPINPAFLPVVANVLDGFFNPQKLDNGDEMVCAKQGKLFQGAGSGTIHCVNPPAGPPVPNTPKTQPKPIVSTPPKVIYRDRIITRDIPGDTVYIPVSVPDVPEIPERRLAETDPFDTTKTSTAPGKTIKVKYTLNSLSYGTLLHEPLSYEQRRIPIRVDDTFAEKFAQKQEAALKNFVRAAGGEDTTAPTPSEPIKNNINEIALTLMGRNYEDFNSTLNKVTPIVGCEGIAAFINYFVNQNYLNFKPVSTVPYSYEIYNPAPNIVYPNPDKAVQELLEKLILSVPSGSGSSGSGEDVDVSELARRLGVNAFPVTVPSTLIQESDNDNKPIAIPDVQLQSLTELVIWFFKRWEEATGQWEIPIEIKDTDPTTPGDQSKRIKLPNLAEAVGEMMLLMLQSAINTETLVNITTRNIIGSEQDKLQNYKTYMSVESIANYLGFQRKDTIEKMPSLIDPTKEKLEEILKEKELDVPVTNFDDKMTFKQQIVNLLEAAAIVKAVYWQPVDTNKDITAQIVKKIKDLNDQFDLVGGDADEQGNNKFDQFINDVEDGFRAYPNVSDATNPYGKPYEQRPKIKKIGNQTSNNP